MTESQTSAMHAPLRTLIIACGALAREINAVIDLNRWEHITLRCLPATLHNHPDRIAPRLDAMMANEASHYDQMFVAYADCGTGGEIDRVIEKYGAQRLPGVHCYAFFAGEDQFHELAGDEIGTFYLTDFLARQFHRLIWVGLGLDRHPELLPMYFGHYTRLVFLSQTENSELERRARAAAEQLGLRYERHHTGLAPFDLSIKQGLEKRTWHN